MVDINNALINPNAVFQTPKEVLLTEDISRDQKIEILRRWEYDTRELVVAEEVNMAGLEPDILDEILAALHALDAWPDTEHSAPTKQSGT